MEGEAVGPGVYRRNRDSLPKRGRADMKRQPILVVDEDVRVQRLLARVLRGARYEVAIAASAREALAVLATRRFGVVVSDLQMPDIDGIELLREIRRRDIDVPIVFVTDTPDAQRADSTFETGAVRYMAKPVDASLFLAAVTRAETLSRLARIQGPLGTTRAARRATGDDGKLERRFEAACARLWMAYQPIVSQRSGTVVAFEALLRSDEPSLASPAAFIGAGERLGRLESIGRRVRAQRMLEAITQLRQHGLGNIRRRLCHEIDADALRAD